MLIRLHVLVSLYKERVKVLICYFNSGVFNETSFVAYNVGSSFCFIVRLYGYAFGIKINCEKVSVQRLNRTIVFRLIEINCDFATI